MPVYDYICNDCHHRFEVVLSLKVHDTQEHNKEELCCPKCKSSNLEQDVTDFYAVTSRKS